MKTYMTALALGLALPATLLLPTMPVAAQTIDNADPARFIDSLSDAAFVAMKGSNRTAARSQFRQLLAQHFAVDAIGERLIRRWSPQITPAQRSAYRQALPNFIIGVYADRLFDYASADIKVLRVAANPAGATVFSQVLQKGQAPIAANWSVVKTPQGYKVTNLTVSGINLAIAQAADFDAVVQRRGFDGLVALLKARG
jgi:phospholipid transport system substrate-binding protein